MKAGWKTVKLDEVCEIVKGRKPTLRAAPAKGDLPYLVARFIRGLEAPEYGSPSERGVVTLTEADTVIICDGSNSGEIFTGLNGIMSSTMGKVVKKTEIYDPYLRHFLSSTFELFNGTKTGSAIPHLDKNAFRKLEIPLPPLAEQKRIVALLDEAFAGIVEAKAKAEEGLSLSKMLFESSLNGMFEVKEGTWVDTQLSDVLEKQPQNGWSPPAANHASEGTPVLTLSSVTGFAFRPDKIKYTSAKVDRSKNYWVENGDLLITRSNTPELVGHVAIAESITTPTIYPDLIMRMTPKSGHATTEFLYYQLRTSKLRNEITGRAQGANPTMKKISNSAVKTLPVSIPSVKIQTQMSAKLKEAEQVSDKLRSMYLEKIGALLELKTSLLAKAFAGELTA